MGRPKESEDPILAEKSAFHDDEEPVKEAAPETNDPQGHDWLDKLRHAVQPGQIKKRKASWSPTGTVDYIEWHTVADILDREIGGCWDFSINEIKQVGPAIMCEATLSIKLGEGGWTTAVHRSGVGVGAIRGDSGDAMDNAIKTAASDALKRCAVMFGVGRDLYTDEPAETDDFYANNTDSGGARTVEHKSFPRTEGKSMAVRNPDDPISDKQIGLLRVLGRKANCDVDSECAAKYDKDLVDLNKGQASEFITYMKEMAGE